MFSANIFSLAYFTDKIGKIQELSPQGKGGARSCRPVPHLMSRLMDSPFMSIADAYFLYMLACLVNKRHSPSGLKLTGIPRDLPEEIGWKIGDLHAFRTGGNGRANTAMAQPLEKVEKRRRLLLTARLLDAIIFWSDHLIVLYSWPPRLIT